MENTYAIYGEYMSRIGNKLIVIPPDVKVDIDGNCVISDRTGWDHLSRGNLGGL